MKPDARPTGTQAIERAILLMKLLTTRGQCGWGLTDLARRAGLEKATAHRILGCLEHERLVERDLKEHRYFPGPMLVELGVSVTPYPQLLAEARLACLRLARSAAAGGAVGLFYLRSGSEAVVAVRSGPGCAETRRNLPDEEGLRRPLLMSAGGVAMLIAMPEDERAAMVERNLREMALMGVPQPARFTDMLARGLALDYAANLQDPHVGLNAFARCVFDAHGAPFGALAVAGAVTTLPTAAGARVARLLDEEARDLAIHAPQAQATRERGEQPLRARIAKVTRA